MPKTAARNQRQYEPGALQEAARKRSQHRTVRLYLSALEYRQNTTGRGLNRERLEGRLARVTEELETATSLERVRLIQEQMDLEASLQYAGDDDGDVLYQELEEDFVDVAREWAERKKITYSSLREAGVPAAVLLRAGIPRTRRRY